METGEDAVGRNVQTVVFWGQRLGAAGTKKKKREKREGSKSKKHIAALGGQPACNGLMHKKGER